MSNDRSKTPSESMGGTRGELVPAREAHRERSEQYNFRRNCVRRREVFGC